MPQTDVIRFRCGKHDCDLHNEDEKMVLMDEVVEGCFTFDLSHFVCPQSELLDAVAPPAPDSEPCDNTWYTELGYFGFQRRKTL